MNNPRFIWQIDYGDKLSVVDRAKNKKYQLTLWGARPHEELADLCALLNTQAEEIDYANRRLEELDK